MAKKITPKIIINEPKHYAVFNSAGICEAVYIIHDSNFSIQPVMDTGKKIVEINPDQVMVVKPGHHQLQKDKNNRDIIIPRSDEEIENYKKQYGG